MSDVSNKLATVSQVKRVKDRIVQSDWNETNTNSMAYIRHIPFDYKTIFSNKYHDYSYTVSDNSFTMPRKDFTSSEWMAVNNADTIYLCNGSNHKNYVAIIYLKGREPNDKASTFTVSQDRWLITYDLGEYGTIHVDLRNSGSGVSVKTNGAWDYVRFGSSTQFFKTSHPFPFYDWERQALSPTPNSLLAVEYDTVSQCSLIRVTNSSSGVTQQYTVSVADGAITLTPTEDEAEQTLYFRYANDSLYFADVTAPGTATATETRLTVDEVTELVTKAHTANIIFFSGDSLFPSNKIIVYKVVDAYEAYGYHYFTTIKSDRANTTSEVCPLCVRSYNRD